VEESSDEDSGAGRKDDDEDGGGGRGDDDKDDREDELGGGSSRDEGEAGGDTDAAVDAYSWRRQSEEVNVSGRGGSDSESGHIPSEWPLTFTSITYLLIESNPAAKRRRLNNGKLIIL
jgi:hypothetical protein